MDKWGVRYSLRQLEVFIAIARTGSVSAAATELGMSQSAASSALSELESQFELQLFDRVGRRVQLGALGRAVRPRAESLLEQARELERALAGHGAAGPLRVGATLTIGNYLVPPLMARFAAEHPGAQVSLQVANTATILERLQNFELDVGLIEGEMHRPALSTTPWCDDALSVFCAPDHPYACRAALDDDDLKAATWVVRERGSGTRQAFERAMAGLLSELSLTWELQHTEAILRAVKAGMGLGCVSRRALQDAFRHGDLVECHVPHRDLGRRFHFALRGQGFRPAAVEQWLSLCRQAYPG